MACTSTSLATTPPHQAAHEAKVALRADGFEGAFVVAFDGEDQIPMSQCPRHDQSPNALNTLRSEFKVGVLAVAGIVLLVLGVNYLKGFNPLSRSKSFFAVYDRRGWFGCEQTLCSSMDFKLDKFAASNSWTGAKVTCLWSFLSEHPNLSFAKNSVAMIHSSDLFGTKAIRIEQGDSEELAMPGDTLHRQHRGRHRRASPKADRAASAQDDRLDRRCGEGHFEH